jgi:hypothetical protein
MKAIKKAVANMKSKAATKIRNVVIWLFKDELKNILSSEGVIDYDPIADRIDYDRIADRIRYANVADYIHPRDVAGYIDSGDLADHIKADEIAECVDMDGLRYELEAYIDSELVEKIQGATLEISL